MPPLGKNLLEPQTERELIIHVNSKVDSVIEKVDSLGDHIVEAVNGMKEVLQTLENGKINNHEERLRNLENHLEQEKGKDAYRKTFNTVISTILAVLSLVVAYMAVK